MCTAPAATTIDISARFLGPVPKKDAYRNLNRFSPCVIVKACSAALNVVFC